jgi:chromosome segregation ATPase
MMAVTALMTTGAFAAGRNPGAQTGIALNKMEIQQQERQNDALQDDIADQQQQIFDLVQEKEHLQADLQSLETRKQQAEDRGRSARVARLDRRISWDQALLQANTDNVREILAAERNDMRLINHNSARIDEEQAAIQSLSTNN